MALAYVGISGVPKGVGPNHLPNPVAGPQNLPKLGLQSRVLGLGLESESRIPMGSLLLGF